MDDLASIIVVDQQNFKGRTDEFGDAVKEKRSTGWTTLILGTLIFILGLMRWYGRHQVIQDKILEKQLLEITNKK